MRYGYTNETRLDGATVTKTYAGPDAALRQAAETRALRALAGHTPVPPLLGGAPGRAELGYVAGEHGQDLIEAGHAEAVLTACGVALRALHSLDPRLLDPDARPGSVIVHGDFGPNNALFTTGGVEVAVLLDWELSGVGKPVTDVAWCEWIVRAHHPSATQALRHFFAAYGATSPWPARQAEMLRRCAGLEDFCRRWDPASPGIGVWQERAAAVRTWEEIA